MGPKKSCVFLKEKGFKEDLIKRTDRSRMADRNRELVPDSWSRVRERVLTTGLWTVDYSRDLGQSQ